MDDTTINPTPGRDPAAPSATGTASGGKFDRAKELIGNKYAAASDAMKNSYGAASETVREKYSAVKEKVSEIDVDEMTNQVRSYVRQHPGKALLISIGIGFVIGLVLRRSDDD